MNWIKSCQNWKLPSLKVTNYESCQFWRSPKLKVAKIESDLVFLSESCWVTKLLSCQITKLPNCQVAKLPSCQIAKLLNCQIAKWPSGQIAKLQVAKLWTCDHGAKSLSFLFWLDLFLDPGSPTLFTKFSWFCFSTRYKVFNWDQNRTNKKGKTWSSLKNSMKNFVKKWDEHINMWVHSFLWEHILYIRMYLLML